VTEPLLTASTTAVIIILNKSLQYEIKNVQGPMSISTLGVVPDKSFCLQL